MNGRDDGKNRVFVFLGHWFTVAPVARHTLAPRRVSASVPFRWTVRDPKYGEVRLSGRLHHAPSDTLLVVVHGLGGDVGSHYVLTAACAAEAAGIASLRVNLRGSDRTGEDIYHAAITQDLHAALASAEAARYSRVLLLGYSLGGHIVLRAATEKDLDTRVRAVAAVCPPLDLFVGARAIDEPARLVYRRHILSAIKEIYAEVAGRRPVPLPLAEARRIGTIRDWDEHIVAPRFGFRGADHYYGESSVAPRLATLSLPSLVVAAEHDPMVPADTLLPVLSGARPPLEVRWIDRGGHVGFPARVDLGFPGPRGLEDQVVAWLLDRAGA